MVSDKTLTEVYMAFQHHTNVNQRTRILGELAEVKGNKSFRDTVKALCMLHGRLLKEMAISEALDRASVKEEVVLESEDGANEILPPPGGSCCMPGPRKSDEGHDGYTG